MARPSPCGICWVWLPHRPRKHDWCRPEAGRPASPVASAAGSTPALPPEAYEDYRPRQPLASYSFDGEHLFTVTLEDGSMWRQTKEDLVKARWNAPAASYYASVTRGSFGSHLLKVSDKHPYRVKRLR